MEDLLFVFSFQSCSNHSTPSLHLLPVLPSLIFSSPLCSLRPLRSLLMLSKLHICLFRVEVHVGLLPAHLPFNAYTFSRYNHAWIILQIPTASSGFAQSSTLLLSSLDAANKYSSFVICFLFTKPSTLLLSSLHAFVGVCFLNFRPVPVDLLAIFSLRVCSTPPRHDFIFSVFFSSSVSLLSSRNCGQVAVHPHRLQTSRSRCFTIFVRFITARWLFTPPVDVQYP